MYKEYAVRTDKVLDKTEKYPVGFEFARFNNYSEAKRYARSINDGKRVETKITIRNIGTLKQ